MQTDERKNEAFQVLDKIVKNPKTFRILAALYIKKGTNF